MKHRTRVLLISLAGLLLVPLLSSTSTAAPAPGTSDVRIIHGLPLDNSGTVVDVYLEAQGAPIAGSPELEDFAFGDTAGPLAIPEGDYTAYITLANTLTVAVQQDLSVPAGLSIDAIASFLPDGVGGWEPGINVFVNDLSASTSDGRVAVRHTAAFGPVDLDVSSRDGSVGPIPIDGLANGQQAALDAPRTKYWAFLAPAGGEDITRTGVQVQRDKLTTVYAVGDPGAGTFQFLEYRLKLDKMAPPT